MSILSIHDAHDAGAGIVSGGKVLGAVNEERFTKLKNDVGFPIHSLRYLLEENGLEDVQKIAIPWIGGSALFARMIPYLEVKRRKVWRREFPKPSRFRMKLRNLFFRVIQDQNPRWLWRAAGETIGTHVFSRRLAPLGINKELVFVEHHTAHAASAYYASGFKEALIVTIDGAGDGVSGTVSTGIDGEIKRVNEFKASASLGILYGAATIACDLRYSEDEGKLMSLAAYSYPSELKELSQISHYDEKRRQLLSSNGRKYEYLLAEYLKDHILWKNNREAFAYAVQKHAEEQVLKIIRQYIKETGIRNVAVSGGFFSNIIANMMINQMPEVKDFFVFPHMGDGGLPIGAAYYVDFLENGKLEKKQIDNLYYGPEYSSSQIEKVLKKHAKDGKIRFEEHRDIAKYTGEKMVDEKQIVLWFQGQMEYGPRGLGNRSVLSLANDASYRNEMNLIIKRRPYYQPFASTILEEDAKKLLEPYARENKFMTTGYRVKKERMGELVAASHIDGTTRPQMLGDENRLYRQLLQKVKSETGVGALLNTSLNKHGQPIVMSPDDALWTLMNTGAKYLAIGDFFVEKK
ncbi:MAG: hypothetical protein KGH53_02455 [Candidatus Micrarchaeota archaeon]|nr:hypothetical protein [Candidatus Micrarchaeota archaeon]